MAEGWIKLHRSIRKNWIWEDAQKLKWWLDILLQANHQERKILLGNELILVERGSFHTSELKLMKRWGVSKTTVRRFLELLESDGMITLEKGKKGTTVKVSNYKDYQGFSDEEKTIKEPQKNHNVYHEETIKEPQSDHTVYTNNNDKELYKNYKELKNGEEGKEGIHKPPSIPSNLLKIERIILDQFGELTYKTWFENSEIREEAKEVEIKVKNKFAVDVINNRFKDILEKLSGKKIIIKGE